MRYRLQHERISHRHQRAGERGYVLLGLLLMAALLVVAAAAVAPRIAQQVRRDREEEMIHRAMQYRRAIRAFAKRTGRFPLRLDELENTDGTRYLRKRYKDPITGGEFRMLHPEDVQASGARLASSQPKDQNSNSPSDQAPSTQVASTGSASTAAVDSAGAASQAAAPVLASSATASFNSGSIAPPGSNTSAGDDSSGNGTPVRGGLILGVASSSTKKTIREFEHKSHYNQWLFFYSAIYDGSLDIKGPTPTNPIFPGLRTSPGSPQPGAPAGQPSP
jgi:type II secretory pathway pseudopilin PulG